MSAADVAIRPASTVCALRRADPDLEVLMVRRAVASEFMGGAYVFPGGAVDAVDRGAVAADALRSPDEEQRPWHAAALRELAEEAGVFVTQPAPTPQLVEVAAGLEGADLYAAVAAAGCRFDATGLAYLSNWVTPLGPPRRFDTRFFVVAVPAETPMRADLHEVTDARWVSPRAAMAEADDGRWKLPFPTRSTLELLDGFATPEDAVDYARRQPEIPRIAPRVLVNEDGSFRILLKGDPGYEDAPA